VRLRLLTAVTVAALVVTGLTACNTKVGAAAFVGGKRISETEVSRYVVPGGVSASASAAAAAQNQTVDAPKSDIVGLLVQQSLWRALLSKNGGVPSAADLAKLHDAAATNLLGTQTTGSALDTSIDGTEKAYGFSPRYRPLLLTTVELEWSLIQRVKATKIADLVALTTKDHVKVTVSAVYGKWDPTALSVTSPDGAVPSFITLPSASPTPTAQG
jgi:hypothetical protein